MLPVHVVRLHVSCGCCGDTKHSAGREGTRDGENKTRKRDVYILEQVETAQTTEMRANGWNIRLCSADDGFFSQRNIRSRLQRNFAT